jgi:hypothetical protein
MSLLADSSDGDVSLDVPSSIDSDIQLLPFHPIDSERSDNDSMLLDDFDSLSPCPSNNASSLSVNNYDFSTDTNNPVSQELTPDQAVSFSGPRILTTSESQEALDQWKSKVENWLADDPCFEPFLSGLTWTRSTRTQPFRGLSGDPPPGQTAQIKLLALNAMLAQISQLCSVIPGNGICKQATSVDMIWRQIYTHFGYKC